MAPKRTTPLSQNPFASLAEIDINNPVNTGALSQGNDLFAQVQSPYTALGHDTRRGPYDPNNGGYLPPPGVFNPPRTEATSLAQSHAKNPFMSQAPSSQTDLGMMTTPRQPKTMPYYTGAYDGQPTYRDFQPLDMRSPTPPQNSFHAPSNLHHVPVDASVWHAGSHAPPLLAPIAMPMMHDGGEEADGWHTVQPVQRYVRGNQEPYQGPINLPNNSFASQPSPMRPSMQSHLTLDQPSSVDLNIPGMARASNLLRSHTQNGGYEANSGNDQSGLFNGGYPLDDDEDTPLFDDRYEQHMLEHAMATRMRGIVASVATDPLAQGFQNANGKASMSFPPDISTPAPAHAPLKSAKKKSSEKAQPAAGNRATRSSARIANTALVAQQSIPPPDIVASNDDHNFPALEQAAAPAPPTRPTPAMSDPAPPGPPLDPKNDGTDLSKMTFTAGPLRQLLHKSVSKKAAFKCPFTGYQNMIYLSTMGEKSNITVKNGMFEALTDDDTIQVILYRVEDHDIMMEMGNALETNGERKSMTLVLDTMEKKEYAILSHGTTEKWREMVVMPMPGKKVGKVMWELRGICEKWIEEGRKVYWNDGSPDAV